MVKITNPVTKNTDQKNMSLIIIRFIFIDFFVFKMLLDDKNRIFFYINQIKVWERLNNRFY